MKSFTFGAMLMETDIRIEKDVLGELEVPKKAYWGINTQRALMNFQISNRKFPPSFLIALAQVKKACLDANLQLGKIDRQLAIAISKALDEIIIEKKHLDQFPIDIFQTGSGTQTNMNMNEVIANRANEILGHPLGKKHPIHPNDHVNISQSSNDVIPTAMHVATIERLNS
ncbi:MAG: lyase family protein, partial [Candidatus Helarchaeales archaeon]